jgi:hypothetical protein
VTPDDPVRRTTADDTGRIHQRAKIMRIDTGRRIRALTPDDGGSLNGIPPSGVASGEVHGGNVQLVELPRYDFEGDQPFERLVAR